MARFDKYNPVSGGFRAKLGFDIAAGDVGVPVGVSIDANGVAQKGTAATTPNDCKGVICPSQIMATGDVVDVMTDGEIVDMTGRTAGEDVYADTTAASAGGLTATATTNKYVGHMVEAWRLVVRIARP